jgi:allantoinase
MTRTNEVDLLVRGDLVVPDGVLWGGSLAVAGERIVGVLGPDAGVAARRHVDATGRYVLPGLVDTHVHTLSSPAEGVAAATAAAAAGGVTTIVDMPYDAPGPVNNRERLAEKIRDVTAHAHVDVGLYGTVAKVDGLEALPDLVSGGVLAFKFSLFETDPVRFPRIADGDLEGAFSALAEPGIPIVLHAELQEVIERLLVLHRGQDDPRVHARTRPVVSETGAIAKALELALWTGARVHVAHVTHPHGFQMLDWYRSRGARVSGETCVHYLALSEDDVVELGPIAKVNPPIRDREAREGLWEELRAGRIATVSTDHAPWPLEAKRRPMLQAASGIPGLETFLPVLHSELVRRGLPIERLAEVACAAPARLFGLEGRKGKLAVGRDADFVVFDPAAEWRFDASRSRSSARWSPFHGRTLRGRVCSTFVRGREVFDGERVTAEAGCGRWLRR